MSAPKPLRSLVAEWRDDAAEYKRLAGVAKQRGNKNTEASYLDMEDDLLDRVKQLEQLCDAWEAQIRSGIEQRKTQQSPGPLYSLGTNQAANDILEHILGAKTP
jgi:hypothetical protein